jgi:hypothetical protein
VNTPHWRPRFGVPFGLADILSATLGRASVEIHEIGGHAAGSATLPDARGEPTRV